MAGFVVTRDELLGGYILAVNAMPKYYDLPPGINASDIVNAQENEQLHSESDEIFNAQISNDTDDVEAEFKKSSLVVFFIGACGAPWGRPLDPGF